MFPRILLLELLSRLLGKTMVAWMLLPSQKLSLSPKLRLLRMLMGLLIPLESTFRDSGGQHRDPTRYG